MASSNQPKYHMLNTTPCWSYWKYEVAMGTGTVTGGIFPSSGLLIGVRLAHAWPPPKGRPRCRLGGAGGVPAQAFFGVFGQQVADGKTTLLGPGRESLGQHGRHDHGAAHAVVAFPRLIGHFGHVPPFP